MCDLSTLNFAPDPRMRIRDTKTTRIKAKVTTSKTKTILMPTIRTGRKSETSEKTVARNPKTTPAALAVVVAVEGVVVVVVVVVVLGVVSMKVVAVVSM